MKDYDFHRELKVKMPHPGLLCGFVNAKMRLGSKGNTIKNVNRLLPPSSANCRLLEESSRVSDLDRLFQANFSLTRKSQLRVSLAGLK